jgi:RNA polymerase sigma-70 factor, ECF subfamily
MGPRTSSREVVTSASEADDWLARFHDGDRRVMEECYREHFATVLRAVGRYLSGADQETVVHEVFFRLLSQPETRRGFGGGPFGSWLATVARHQAIDFLRRYRREQPLPDDDAAAGPDEAPPPEARLAARALVERFRRERLPEKWRPVFDARFMQQLSQREAAAALGLSRTTLAYRELRIRARLRRFVLRTEEP